MADKKISELSALTGALNVADALPISDDSASATKKISPKALLEQGIILIDPGSIPADKIEDTGPTEITDGSVTAIKLADNSSGVVSAGLPGGIRVGQVGVDSTNGKFYVWDGGQWLAVKAAGSVNQITFANVGPIFIDGTQTGDTVDVVAAFTQTTGAGEFLAGPSGSGGAIAQRRIVGADLPAASSTEPGAIIVDGGGLKIENGILSIDNSVTAASDFYLVEYNEQGLVTEGRLITGADLPQATNTEYGAVIPGNGLYVDPYGSLSIDNNVTPGTNTKVTYNSQGLITQGESLTADDLPEIPGDKITGSNFDGAVIADRSIAEIKLADYSTCLVQEGQPTGDFKLGQMWFTPSTSQLRVYGRGSSGDLWLSVGFGALQAQNLRWAGTCNADTSTITTLTDIGVSEGLTSGGPIPTPTDELSGLYFVVETAGSGINIPNVNGDLCTEGDWILYIDQAQGAIHLDIAAGGGGGGGAGKLNDLTDVDLKTLADKQVLQYQALSGLWENITLSASDVGALAPGDDISQLNNDSGFITAADVGDGTISIKKSDGTEVGSFTVNQAGDTDILLPADVVPADPNLQAVLDAGNTSTTGLEIGDSGELIELKPTGVIEASSLIRVNTDAAAPREGVLINGDLAINTGNYGLRLHGGADLTAADYSIVGRDASGITEIRAAGGWGENYFFGATTSFINISNDNGFGRPTPIPGAEAVVHVYNGLNTQFGTEADPLGNVMPKDDWSSIPSLT